MPESAEFSHSPDAAVLGPAGVHSLAVGQALGKVRAALSKPNAASRDLCAVVVFGKGQAPHEFDYLKTVNAFLEAYWRGWRALSRLSKTARPHARAGQFQAICDLESSNICVYSGHASAKEVKEKMAATPGVYIVSSQWNASLLESLGLPAFPEPFREMPLVIQVKTTAPFAVRAEPALGWNPWDTLARQVAVEDKAEQEIARDTLEWRREFMSQYECWTSAQVATESTSTAKNVSAIASRWLTERRIFALRFEGKTWFPRFQFQDGSPIPVIAAVIKLLPPHSTGWDFAFFFTAPNSYIAGRKPVELLKTDPRKVESLAQAFANPADAF